MKNIFVDANVLIAVCNREYPQAIYASMLLSLKGQAIGYLLLLFVWLSFFIMPKRNPALKKQNKKC